jgi:structural maintenance of chromosome 2
VVVDTEQTGKILLEKGGLRKRVTIIPLSKIEARTIPAKTQHAAAKLVGDYFYAQRTNLVLKIVCY